MSTVASTSFLPLLATASAAVPLSMTAARDAGIPGEDLVIFRTRLSEQVIGAASPFSDKVGQLADILGRGNPKQIPGAKIQVATAWNDLDPRLRLDAQIAAAYVTGELALPKTMGEIAEKDHGVIGPNGERAERFHNSQASIVAAVRAEGSLGEAEIRKLRRWVIQQGIGENHQSVLGAAQELAEENFLRAARLFFLSALLLQEEWQGKKPRDGVPPAEIAERLMWAAENLYKAGERRPVNQYLGDVIGLSRVAVLLSPSAEKGVRLAALQEALAEKLEPRAEEARPKANQLIASALYWLDAAANWNNAEETEAARRAFEKSVGLLQLAGRLPAQAGTSIAEDN